LFYFCDHVRSHLVQEITSLGVDWFWESDRIHNDVSDFSAIVKEMLKRRTIGAL